MQLDQISANVRHRTAWEGIDLGFVMARHWFLRLWVLWWITALPVVVLAVVLLHQWPMAAGMLVWWLKPLYEPLLLFWLSRRLFGEELSLRETLGEWRRVLRPRLLSNLTLRRLSANRSFYMPVSHLEGLKGAERLKRLKVLGGTHSAGTWLTFVGVHIEMALEFGFLLLALYLVPEQLLPDDIGALIFGDEPLVTWMLNGWWLLAMSIFAPFYVAGGFALYLTRRSELEAWDLELAFRRMAPRLRPMRAAAVICALALTALVALPSGEVRAEEPAAESAESVGESVTETVVEEPVTEPESETAAQSAPGLTAEAARKAIDEVMAEKDFGEKRTSRYWKYIGKKSETKKTEKPDFAWVQQLAEFIEYALWIAGAVALGWVLLYLLRLTDWLPQKRARRTAGTPTILFGMPVTPDSLPDDIVGAVQALLAEGRVRVALSLLYRATLVRLLHEHHLKIPDSATEGECQRLVSRQRPTEEAEYFTRLTRVWVWCAYGHVLPDKDDVAALAARWNSHYGAVADAQR